MKYESAIYQMTVEGHTFWVAESKQLKGCIGQGDTSDAAIKELEENEIEWLQTAREFGIPIPPQAARKESAYSGKFALRMSPYLHEKTSGLAASQNISLNQYINNAVSEYNMKVELFSKHSSNTFAEYTESSEKIIQLRDFQKASNNYSVTLEEM